MNPAGSNPSVHPGRGRGPWRWIATAVGCTLAAGCATQPPPRDLDLRGTTIVTGVAAPKLDVNGLPGGKAAGAAVGAGTGSGIGVVAGSVACLAAGPFFPLCLATLVPAGAMVGAATGGVVGAVRTESTDAIALKGAALRSELTSTSYPIVLADALRERLLTDYSLDLARTPALPDPSGPGSEAVPVGEPPLEMVVSVSEVGTEGKRQFAVRLVTGLVLRRGATVIWQIAREVQSDTELNLDQWTAGDARALRGVLDQCVRTAARRLVAEIGRGIAGPPASRERVGGRYSTSCDDRPDDWKVVATAP